MKAIDKTKQVFHERVVNKSYIKSEFDKARKESMREKDVLPFVQDNCSKDEFSKRYKNARIYAALSGIFLILSLGILFTSFNSVFGVIVCLLTTVVFSMIYFKQVFKLWCARTVFKDWDARFKPRQVFFLDYLEIIKIDFREIFPVSIDK